MVQKNKISMKGFSTQTYKKILGEIAAVEKCLNKSVL